MNRRRFLCETLAGGGLAVGAGGYLFVRRNQARADRASDLLSDALPALVANSTKELSAFPTQAREEIKRYFHGKCLNVEGFVSHLCSNEFAERLGRCSTLAEREGCFLYAFCSRVATEIEILNQVKTIAADIGSELDSSWSAYGMEISAKWNTRMGGYDKVLAADDLSNRLSAVIRAELGQAARQAMTSNQRPAIGATIGKIGESAVLLLPLVRFGPLGLQIGVPLFLLLAVKQVWEYAMGQLENRRGDYQAAISGRLALLGNRVGAEFEREVRLRLTDLHIWQERSIRETANRLVEERIGLL